MLWLGRWTRVFPDWPSSEWIASVHGQHDEVEPAELSLAGLQRLASQLRSWAPRLLSSLPDDDDGDTMMTLEKEVRLTHMQHTERI